MKIVSLVGARPQFIKETVVNKAVCESNSWRHVLVHSGQRYDFNMSALSLKNSVFLSLTISSA